MVFDMCADCVILTAMGPLQAAAVTCICTHPQKVGSVFVKACGSVLKCTESSVFNPLMFD